MVYVDDINAHGCVNERTGFWCRLWADSDGELHAKARELGISLQFFCPNPGHDPYTIWGIDIPIFQASYLVTREMAFRAVKLFGVKQMRESYAY